MASDVDAFTADDIKCLNVELYTGFSMMQEDVSDADGGHTHISIGWEDRTHA